MGECKDASSLTGTAAELFQVAALLMGNGAQAVELVEQTISTLDIDPCLEPEQARRTARQAVLAQGAATLAAQSPNAFSPTHAEAAGCVDDEDLSWAGLTPVELKLWLSGEGRADLRAWLTQLPSAQRVIFIQRAVLGHGNTTSAATLNHALRRTDWTPEAVSETYRHALCSLANALAHTPAAGLVDHAIPVPAQA